MLEIRFHGRGGQGVVTAADLLARAAFLSGNIGVQALPFFGAERRGAPVISFTRIDSEPIILSSQVYEPDYVIVFEESILKEAIKGLKPGGWVVLNTRKDLESVDVQANLCTVNATDIVLKRGLVVAGFPIINSTILGAFPRICSSVKIESVLEAVEKYLGGKVGRANAESAREAYENAEVRGEI